MLPDRVSNPAGELSASLRGASPRSTLSTLWSFGAPVAQWFKCWPTDLAVPSSSLARGEIFSTVNGVIIHTARCALLICISCACSRCGWESFGFFLSPIIPPSFSLVLEDGSI